MGSDPPKLVVYFAHDFTDVSTLTRVRGFLDHGLRVAVVAFRRTRYNPDFETSWQEVELGQAPDGRYLLRAVKLLRALWVLWRTRTLLRETTVLYARNMDLLLLAVVSRLLFARRAQLVYEVLDVVPILTGRGPVSAAFRFAERCLLRFVDAMVVSSPAFHRGYYQPVQGYAGRTFVIENRLPASAVAAIERSAGPSISSQNMRKGYKWAIGYVGIIRGQATVDLIVRLAERFPDILFSFRGVLTTVDHAAFAAAVAARGNLVFGGPYVNPDDLKEIYGALDFTWALDLEHTDHNSRWLMPCRFYESSLIGVPCLAARGFEVGDRVDALGIGWTLAGPDYEESFARLFHRLTRADYDAVIDRLAALPSSTFMVGDEMAAFCRAITGEEDAAAAPLLADQGFAPTIPA